MFHLNLCASIFLHQTMWFCMEGRICDCILENPHFSEKVDYAIRAGEVNGSKEKKPILLKNDGSHWLRIWMVVATFARLEM